MKKLMSLLLVIALALVPLGLVGCGAKGETLALLSQGEYMDESIFAEFEAQYLKDTGKTITVTMSDAKDNEEMLTEIEDAKEKYDLICPSDYMIEKLIAKELLLPIDRDVLKIEEYVKPEYIQITKGFDPTLAFSVPYMYGTFGIMYNYEKTNKHIDSWSHLFTDNGPVFVKSSLRDTFTAACIFLKTSELATASDNFTNNNTAEYQKLVQAIFQDTSAETISAVESLIVAQKKWKKLPYDDEQGKLDMADNKASAGLFWSCDAGYVMKDFELDDGTQMLGNKKLWYSIPKEGGNIYMDSFVMPKYAQNKPAANAFLKFLCSKDAAKKNSVYCGAISPVTSVYDELKTELVNTALTTGDANAENVFNNVSQEWKDMYIEMLFPSQATLNRCGSMRDYKDRESDVITRITSAMNS